MILNRNGGELRRRRDSHIVGRLAPQAAEALKPITVRIARGLRGSLKMKNWEDFQGWVRWWCDDDEGGLIRELWDWRMEMGRGFGKIWKQIHAESIVRHVSRFAGEGSLRQWSCTLSRFHQIILRKSSVGLSKPHKTLNPRHYQTHPKHLPSCTSECNNKEEHDASFDKDDIDNFSYAVPNVAARWWRISRSPWRMMQKRFPLGGWEKSASWWKSILYKNLVGGGQ